MNDVMNQRRVRYLNAQPRGTGPVVYWMSRDQRLKDNWALIYACEEARHHHVPCAIIFCIVPQFLGATPRQYAFMFEGLRELGREAYRRHIPFCVVVGDPTHEIPSFVERYGIGLLVTDFSPLRISRQWHEQVAKTIPIACVEVDAHNIVPCWIVSDHQEFAARTLRPKLQRMLPEFLEEFPSVSSRLSSWSESFFRARHHECEEYLATHGRAMTHGYVWKSGEKAASQALSRFLKTRLSAYDEARNDPTCDGQSNISPYLHFGQLSPQRVALEVHACEAPQSAKDAFLEEVVVRRELAENFCFYQPEYDSIQAFPAWARRTLEEHRQDTRPVIYSYQRLERAETHDVLWNACQLQMVKTGKMHGYMRMYWAKKILEWTKTPQDALRIAIALNDTYELDGRDPNGYTGIAWAVGGVHDRPWIPRPIFGTIRYMNERGARSKFDVDAYIAKWTSTSNHVTIRKNVHRSGSLGSR